MLVHQRVQHIMGSYSQIPSGWAHGWSPTSLSAAASTSRPSSVFGVFFAVLGCLGSTRCCFGPWENPRVYGRLWGLYLYIYIYIYMHTQTYIYIYIHNSLSLSLSIYIYIYIYIYINIYALYAYNIYIYMCNYG